MFKLDSVRPALRGSRIALVVGLFFLTVSALGAPFGADPERAEALLAELEERYEILTLSDSYLLQPNDPDADFRSIEVKAQSVAVDGEVAEEALLRQLVGEDATQILELSQLGSDAWSATEELRRRIEQLAAEESLRTDEIAEEIRAQARELENLEQEHLDVIEEALEEQRRAERRRDRRSEVRTDTRVSFGSGLTIEENETSRDVVVIGNSLDVEGRVRGDAVIVGGSAEIRGEVSGSVTAVGGSISLGPGAKIRGDAIAIGGAVDRDSSAEIHGEITEISLGTAFELDDVWDGDWWPGSHGGWLGGWSSQWHGLGELFVRVAQTLLLLLFLVLLLVLFPRFIEQVARRASREPWKAGLMGLGAQLLFLFALPVICIILLVTIVGIPLALILGPLATVALIVFFYLGFAGVCIAGGRLLENRFGWRSMSPAMLLLAGLILIQGWSILGGALGILGGPIRIFAWCLLLLGFMVKYVSWTIGLGAVLLHQFSPLPDGGIRPESGPRRGPSPPPPPSAEDQTPSLQDLLDETTGSAEDDVYLQAGASDADERDQEAKSGSD